MRPPPPIPRCPLHRKESDVTAAEFELLADAEAECLLRQRLRTFLEAGADPCEALILAAQVEVSEAAVVELLRQGVSGDLTLRLLYPERRVA